MRKHVTRFVQQCLVGLVVSLVAGCLFQNGGDGGVVGFKTGRPRPGPVPSDGTAPGAPQIDSMSLAKSDIERGAALRVSVDFSDEDGDVEAVLFGVDGEGQHFELSAASAAGSTSGTIILELFPGSYVPGRYTLVLSLVDAMGHVSAAKRAPFVILDPDGSPPDKDPDGSTTRPDSGPGPNPDTGSSGGGGSFIMGHTPEGQPATLVRVTPGTGSAPNIATLTDVVPMHLRRDYTDYRNGWLAMIAAPEVRPPAEDNVSGIAVIELSNPSQVYWAPIPPAPDADHHYVVPDERPQLFPDGRLVYKVVHRTNSQWDDYHQDVLGVWDPKSGKLELQPLVTPMYLALPEVDACNPECDMEVGTLTGPFATAADNRTVYFTIHGFGVDMMMIHRAHAYLGRYDAQTRQTEILEYLNSDAAVYAVTGDGKWVALSHEGKFKKYDVTTDTLTVFDDYPDHVHSGQVAGAGFIKGWRQCEGGYGGVVYFDLGAGDAFRVIDPALYEEGKKGLDAANQISADGKMVYFMASADACTNYAADFVVMSSPLEENNPTPKKLFELGAEYSTNMFVLER